MTKRAALPLEVSNTLEASEPPGKDKGVSIEGTGVDVVGNAPDAGGYESGGYAALAELTLSAQWSDLAEKIKTSR